MNVIFVVRILLPAFAALSISAAALADGTPPPSASCIVGQGGPGHTPDGAACIPLPPSTQELAIGRASEAWYKALVANQQGRATAADVGAAARGLAAARGESALPTGEPNRISREIQQKLGLTGPTESMLNADEIRSQSGSRGGVSPYSGIPLGTFYPFTQINGDYCGPATAESILFYIGYGAYRQSQYYDPNFASAPWYGYPNLSGDAPVGGFTGPQWDQSILDDAVFLNTYVTRETSWGAIPVTLNRWMGKTTTTGYRSIWTQYASDQATKDSVWNQSMSSDSQGWAVAENVRYVGSLSYTPSGFSIYGDYVHWDVLYGGYASNWIRYAQIGQVYGEPYVNGAPHVTNPYQTYFWEFGSNPRPHWTALQWNHGVVLH